MQVLVTWAVRIQGENYTVGVTIQFPDIYLFIYLFIYFATQNKLQ